MYYKLFKSDVVSEIRACLALAVPLAGAQVAQAATGFADTVMMGWLGSQTLAAGGLGSIAFTTLLLISSGMVSAVSPLTAEAYGADQPELAGRVAVQGLWLALLLSLPMMLLLWFAEPILHQLGQEKTTVMMAGSYLQAIVWGVFPGLGFAALRSFVTALSRPRPIMGIVMVGTLFNIAGNYMLMFGKFGFPALGLAGIGWSSTFSLWFSFLAVLLYLVLNHRFFHPYRVLRRLHQFDPQLFWQLLQVGLPIGGLFAVEVGLFTVTTFLMGQLGSTVLAAHQVVLQTAGITFMVTVGISVATTVRVGQLVGCKDYGAAQLAGYVGIGIGSAFMGLMALLLWGYPRFFVALYLDLNQPENLPVLRLAISLLGVAALFQIVDGIQIIVAGALRGLKDTQVPMIMGLLAYWCIGLSSGYWLGMRLGLGGVGLWWGLAIGLTAASLILTWRFHALTQSLKHLQEPISQEV